MNLLLMINYFNVYGISMPHVAETSLEIYSADTKSLTLQKLQLYTRLLFHLKDYSTKKNVQNVIGGK